MINNQIKNWSACQEIQLHINYKLISDHFEKNDQIESEIINVYMRNVNKQARLVQVHASTKSSELVTKASTSFNIPSSQIILFYNGFRIDNFNTSLNLTERCIIHIIDNRNINNSKTSITFRVLEWNVPQFKLVLNPDMSIKQMVFSLVAPRFGIDVYVGKVLNYSSTLKQEFVEDRAEITIIKHKRSNQKQSIQYNDSHYMLQTNAKQLKKAQINYPYTKPSISISIDNHLRKQSKAILQLESNYHLTKRVDAAKGLLSEINNQKDSFISLIDNRSDGKSIL